MLPLPSHHFLLVFPHYPLLLIQKLTICKLFKRKLILLGFINTTPFRYLTKINPQDVEIIHRYLMKFSIFLLFFFKRKSEARLLLGRGRRRRRSSCKFHLEITAHENWPTGIALRSVQNKSRLVTVILAGENKTALSQMLCCFQKVIFLGFCLTEWTRISHRLK